jgi:hypothetical protein
MRSILPRSCSYAGTGYANPHAVTSVGGTTYTYDNNGNVTAIGSLDYTWDWRNRLSSAERSGGGITTYGYDHTGQRVFQATGSATTRIRTGTTTSPRARFLQRPRSTFSRPTVKRLTTLTPDWSAPLGPDR